VQSVLNFTRHAGAKAAKPEQFIDNSLLIELEKSGFVKQLYGQSFDTVSAAKFNE
jgi:hypothetical protein